MNYLPDAREACGPVEMLADHCQTHGAAVGHVNLKNVREGAQAFAFFGVMSVGIGETSGSIKTNVNLARADNLFDGRACGQHLFSEICGNDGVLFVIVLGDAGGDLFFEIRVIADQLLKCLRRQLEQSAIGDGLDARRARGLFEERDFAEEIAFAQIPEIFPLPVFVFDKGSKPAFFDNVHRPRRIASPNDQFAARKRDWLKLPQKQSQRLDRQFGERRVEAKEIVQAAMFDLQIKMRLDLRV
ncbi:MAG: hypothetical protein JMDDDDMK_00053 [Acidobacteria bacterium]|nr:hypothetical protein [Acidobacteriota bacterium]